ncbi:MAG: CBS domain-containing protein [archaeon YNP-LCB-003-016]|jgi:CBS domain-containing protein|uniref:CBS domain-containing protein n=1 Tax=Candidatus Culexarchaeum yellowstonense TaxID=2928963 RepID=UPI0026ED9B01|nr:CBS domain-containing protein [Candidatus Culexarchaeum yellowstonense]MCC6018846.1 CBS domain-containing protein [Candidatus Verstraetearchaeota archaeon]MCR6624058.1 CBS domain-containing protein [Candidatus Culexarchaeum yellowstonense]MCR6692739.1 CBS domain-containing protein [Candidatus Culexarchaeum yellowstonense]
MIRIIDIAVKDVKVIDEDETVVKAADIMSQYNIGCLVVVKDGKPVGIVTERDMLKRVIVPCLDPRTTKVSKVMSKPLIYGDPDMDLVYAAKFMINNNIKRLPIIDRGKLVGIVTLTDILRALPEVVKALEESLIIDKLHPRFRKLLKK